MDFDVIIVGGGAVGATLALELEHLDYRVAVIELRQPIFASGDPERVIALNYGSRRHFERLGLWQEIAATGIGDIRHIMVTEVGNRGRVDMDVSDCSGHVPALGHVVAMGPMLEPIFQRLSRSSVQLFSPASVSAFTLLADVVTIQLLRDGNTETLTAALIIGADGSNSQIRRMAGIDTFGWDYNRFGIVASVQCDRGHGHVAYECFRQSGPLALLPLSDGRFSIVWVAAPGEAAHLLDLDDETFIRVLSQAAGEQALSQIGAFSGISKRAVYPLELTIAGAFAKPRLALIGNAAHTLHPVAGQGMNLGLRDVLSLLEVLASDLARTDPGQSILMQAYAGKRRADVIAVTAFTESMVRCFGSEMPAVKWLRGMALKHMPNISFLHHLLLTQAAGIAQTEKQYAGARHE